MEYDPDPSSTVLSGVPQYYHYSREYIRSIRELVESARNPAVAKNTKKSVKFENVPSNDNDDIFFKNVETPKRNVNNAETIPVDSELHLAERRTRRILSPKSDNNNVKNEQRSPEKPEVKTETVNQDEKNLLAEQARREETLGLAQEQVVRDNSQKELSQDQKRNERFAREKGMQKSFDITFGIKNTNDDSEKREIYQVVQNAFVHEFPHDKYSYCGGTITFDSQTENMRIIINFQNGKKLNDKQELITETMIGSQPVKNLLVGIAFDTDHTIESWKFHYGSDTVSGVVGGSTYGPEYDHDRERVLRKNQEYENAVKNDTEQNIRETGQVKTINVVFDVSWDKLKESDAEKITSFLRNSMLLSFNSNEYAYRSAKESIPKEVDINIVNINGYVGANILFKNYIYPQYRGDSVVPLRSITKNDFKLFTVSMGLTLAPFPVLSWEYIGTGSIYHNMKTADADVKNLFRLPPPLEDIARGFQHDGSSSCFLEAALFVLFTVYCNFTITYIFKSNLENITTGDGIESSSCVAGGPDENGKLSNALKKADLNARLQIRNQLKDLYSFIVNPEKSSTVKSCVDLKSLLLQCKNRSNLQDPASLMIELFDIFRLKSNAWGGYTLIVTGGSTPNKQSIQRLSVTDPILKISKKRLSTLKSKARMQKVIATYYELSLDSDENQRVVEKTLREVSIADSEYYIINIERGSMEELSQGEYNRNIISNLGSIEMDIVHTFPDITVTKSKVNLCAIIFYTGNKTFSAMVKNKGDDWWLYAPGSKNLQQIGTFDNMVKYQHGTGISISGYTPEQDGILYFYEKPYEYK